MSAIRRKVFALAMFVAFVAAASPLFAQNSLDQIKAAGVIKIGTEGSYAPFTYHDSTGALVGFDVEIAREVAKRLGVRAEFIEGKWDGLIAGLDARRYDIVANEVTITEARKAKFDFSKPYIVSKAVLIVRESEKAIKSFADLKGKKSGQALTSNFGRLAQENGAILVGVDGFNQSVDLLLSGRVDATINDSLSYLDFKKQKPDAKLKVVASLESAEAQGIIMRKGNPELLAAIDKALADAKADGTYLAISMKYFGEDVSN
ncbi:MAG: amino acid ABC transporter substrate-binding protein [Rectinemataceae bacterium]